MNLRKLKKKAINTRMTTKAINQFVLDDSSQIEWCGWRCCIKQSEWKCEMATAV